MPCGGWADAAAVCGAEASLTNASASPFDEEREGVSILVDEFVKKRAEKQKLGALYSWTRQIRTPRNPGGALRVGCGPASSAARINSRRGASRAWTGRPACFCREAPRKH